MQRLQGHKQRVQSDMQWGSRSK